MICRVEKTKGFTVMSNYHLRDENLSLKAKGLLSLVLSLPEKWDYSIKGLESICKEGKASVASALKELEEFKYLERERVFGEKNRITGFTYVFYEFPKSPYTDFRYMESPYPGFPYTDFPDMENHPQLNTNILTTELLNIEKINKDQNATTSACEDRYVLKEQFVLAKDGHPCAIALISDAQLESLNKELSPDEFAHYMRKYLYLKVEGYQYSCSDYEYIMRMVEADRKIRKEKGV